MRWLAASGGLGLLLATSVMPQPGRAEPSVVLEFFTSQGCSTCPPADAIFSELSQIPGVVALALHVDYWDYLGWKDPFGKAEHTERQRAYARAHKERTIYTPQMIVHGQDIVKGQEKAMILEQIAAHEDGPELVSLEVSREAEGVEIRIAPADKPVGPAEVHVVEYIPAQAMTVESGENAGYHHIFANVVTHWTTVALWDGVSSLTLHHDSERDENIAVLVQAPNMGPVLSATTLDQAQ